MIESRQSYCKESRVQFFWPTLYLYSKTDITASQGSVAKHFSVVGYIECSIDCCQLSAECASERSLRIGQHLM